MGTGGDAVLVVPTNGPSLRGGHWSIILDNTYGIRYIYVMSYEDMFWRGTSEVRSCEACSFKMTQLLNSWVCDRCAPPESGAAIDPPNTIKIKIGSVYYTYSTSAALDEVGPGYKLYTDFDYIIKKASNKATTASRSYYIYEVEEAIEDYVDTSGLLPASARAIKVNQVWTVNP